MPQDKLSALKDILLQCKSLVIAYSGGADSTFLLKVANDVLGGRVLAVTARSETYTEEEASFAEHFCRDNGIRHKFIRTNEFKDENFVSNPPDRCYFCKKELFSKLKKIAKSGKYEYVVDGTNSSDSNDYRPGSRAKEELKVKSPLMGAAIGKNDIISMSKEMGLSTWNRHSSACLASRIPYGTRITKDLLSRIHEGEKFLRGLGLGQVRARHHGNLVRIEVEKDKLSEVLQEDIADEISRKFKKLGYIYITIDARGYRTGSMNEGF